MPSPKKPAESLELDPRSADVVLYYVGDGRAPRGVPADDLTQNQLARLVYIRSLDALGNELVVDPKTGIGSGIRPDQKAPDPKVAAEIVNELVATGWYSTEPAQASTTEAAPAAEG